MIVLQKLWVINFHPKIFEGVPHRRVILSTSLVTFGEFFPLLVLKIKLIYLIWRFSWVWDCLYILSIKQLWKYVVNIDVVLLIYFFFFLTFLKVWTLTNKFWPVEKNVRKKFAFISKLHSVFYQWSWIKRSYLLIHILSSLAHFSLTILKPWILQNMICNNKDLRFSTLAGLFVMLGS